MRTTKLSALFASVILLSACQTSTLPTPPENTSHWATVVDQSVNLYQVDKKLFRSEQLSAKDYPLLKQHNVRTIVNLRFFDRNDDQEAFGETGIKLVNTPLISWSISPQEVADVLWQIRQAQQTGGVLVHCYHGADRTGLISAMYRVIYQKWPSAEAKREMMQGPYGFHSIWQNMPNFFTDENVQAIQQRLDELAKK